MDLNDRVILATAIENELWRLEQYAKAEEAADRAGSARLDREQAAELRECAVRLGIFKEAR